MNNSFLVKINLVTNKKNLLKGIKQKYRKKIKSHKNKSKQV